MIWQIVGSVVRAALQAVGGTYVGQGLLTQDDLAKGIGALLFLIGLSWSIWQKARKRTVPGQWNPHAEVRRAEPVKRREK